ncbi:MULTISPECIES: hypothetical protein [unclassified Wolbachia]|uniref:hypothetical protein n=1 Tax=unclassified Wolbachia TaxID=2640676 RepID=UPI00143C10F6|nr:MULTISPECIES: hypothetical protein [unclassified Wolbachia]
MQWVTIRPDHYMLFPLSYIDDWDCRLQPEGKIHNLQLAFHQMIVLLKIRYDRVEDWKLNIYHITSDA